MYTFQLISTLIILISCLLSCTESKSSKNSDSDNILPISINGHLHTKSVNGGSLAIFDVSDLNRITEVRASDIDIENIKYIPLEHKKNGQISYMMEIESDDKSIYISSLDDIKRFDWKGKFIGKIGRKGKGPTEYPLINDFSIDSYSNVYVLSRDLKKIFVYSSNGKFIKTISSPYNASDLCCYNDGILCYSMDIDGTVENSFHVIDYNGKVIKQFPNKYKYPDRIRHIRGEFISLCGNMDRIYIKEQLSDTIFTLSGMNINPKLVIYRGGKLIKREILSKTIAGSSFKDASKNYIFDLRTIILRDYIYLEFIKGDKGYGFFAKLKDSKGYLMNLDKHGIINDYDGGPDIWLQKRMDNHTIISWIDAYKLITYVNSNKFKNSTPKYPEKKNELKKLANTMHENDNPVLMLIKLK